MAPPRVKPQGGSNARQPVSLVYDQDGQFVGEYDAALCCGNPTNDGGIMPQPFDIVPAGKPEQLRGGKGGRFMKQSPYQNDAPPLDTEPLGGPPNPKKLYSRRDAPWAGTHKGKEFSRPEYQPDPADDYVAIPEPVLGPPMRTGKMPQPAAPFEHIEDAPVAPAEPFRAALKAGRAPATFQANPYSGPQAVAPPREAKPKRVAPRPPRAARKKDTFGDYPAHMSDPYLDDPMKALDDKMGRWAKGKRPMLTCQCKGAPTIPVVNVWDHPACLQSKAGVVKRPQNVQSVRPGASLKLADQGRLGTSV